MASKKTKALMQEPTAMNGSTMTIPNSASKLKPPNKNPLFHSNLLRNLLLLPVLLSMPLPVQREVEPQTGLGISCMPSKNECKKLQTGKEVNKSVVDAAVAAPSTLTATGTEIFQQKMQEKMQTPGSQTGKKVNNGMAVVALLILAVTATEIF
eukprot:11536654-Ditylum_brightwellii.AAC.1